MRKPRIHPRRYPKFGASRAHGLVIIMHQIPRHFRQPYEEPSDDDMKEEFQGPLIDLNTCIEETKRLCGDSIYMQENTQFTPEEMESSKRKINERIDTLSAYAGIHPTRDVEVYLIAVSAIAGARKLRQMEPNVPKELSKIMDDQKIPMAAVLSTTRKMIINLRKQFGIHQPLASPGA